MGLLLLLLLTLQGEPVVVDSAGQERPLRLLIDELSDDRVVFIGEDHDNYAHHLAQLDVIQRLHESAPQRWVIGLEFFQRQFQQHLDDYVAGTISEREFLNKTDYFQRWGYDYRLYRPILRFAKERGIRVVALNVETELRDRVSEAGLEGLAPNERARLPEEIDKSDNEYRQRLEAIFREHSNAPAADFERFVEVQLVWDETMAESAAAYLAANPDKAMVALAGTGHLSYGAGIPNRVRRRLPEINSTILISANERTADRQGANYLLVAARQSLAPAGRMGISFDTGTGAFRIRTIQAGSAAAQTDLRAGDRFVSIAGEPVETLTDARLALLDRQPGERVSVRVQRDGPAGSEELSFEITLQP